MASCIKNTIDFINVNSSFVVILNAVPNIRNYVVYNALSFYQNTRQMNYFTLARLFCSHEMSLKEERSSASNLTPISHPRQASGTVSKVRLLVELHVTLWKTGTYTLNDDANPLKRNTRLFPCYVLHVEIRTPHKTYKLANVRFNLFVTIK